jgi:hypothetical protein
MVSVPSRRIALREYKNPENVPETSIFQQRDSTREPPLFASGIGTPSL